ncbi:MAG TPA: 50S ribosomal protein L4 [Candidatus Pacearchaeota archaeon]|nr:50S ribosomal protein L4 [Candidatus Parcubacteria bacterium]HOU45813.1 50S ribosomal protein L4 [Candidatus Pacearchaeota archaeon]HQI74398.1 50S ribosomal protein L4 [Candidatus Pacearchaeota archaeon]
MKIEVYNQKGEKSGSIDLPKEIFEVEIKPELIHQIATSQYSNKRQNSAHTKDRGEVSGSNKKPHAQKGTGRARAGSKRSPLWIGGGITFGPRNERSYKKEIPKKMKRKALFMVLSGKLRDKELIVLEDLKFDKAKTKDFAGMMKLLPLEKRKTCIVATQDYDKNIIRAAGNIKGIEVIESRNLNVLDLLSSKYLLITKGGIDTVKNIFLKK